MKKESYNKNVLPGACSCMTLTSKSGKHYWFRTCDIETDLWKDGAHVVKKSAGEEIVYVNGEKEISQYYYSGMAYNSFDSWLLDGVNEHGLVGGLLMLYEGTSVEKAEEGKTGYVGMELVTKILSACKNVNEIEKLAEQIQILDIPYGNHSVPATMHYFFTDSSGDEVILEATQEEKPGIIRIFKKNEILGVMTNSPPYEEQVQNLSWFLSQSPEMRHGFSGRAITELVLDGRVVKAEAEAEHLSLTGIFPASYSSYDRFIRLAVLKFLNDSGNEFADVKMLAMGSTIMNAVCEPHTKGMFHYTRMECDGRVIGQKDSFTQYITMYDIEETCFYMRKYDEVKWEKYK